eukprot:233828-Amphidinium_carterae.1
MRSGGNASHPLDGYRVQHNGAAWSLWEMRGWGNRDICDRYNFGCVDMLPYLTNQSYLVWDFPFLVGASYGTGTTCADMQGFCNMDTPAGFRARLHCPVT